MIDYKNSIRQLIEVALLDSDNIKRINAIEKLEKIFPEQDIFGYSNENSLFLRICERKKIKSRRCFFMTTEGICESIIFKSSFENNSEIRYLGELNRNYKGYSGRVYPFSNLDNLEKRNNNIYY